MQPLQTSPIRGLADRRRVSAYNPYLPRVVNAVQRFNPNAIGRNEGRRHPSNSKLSSKLSRPTSESPDETCKQAADGEPVCDAMEDQDNSTADLQSE